jgi:hypothetical protein
MGPPIYEGGGQFVVDRILLVSAERDLTLLWPGDARASFSEKSGQSHGENS